MTLESRTVRAAIAVPNTRHRPSIWRRFLNTLDRAIVSTLNRAARPPDVPVWLRRDVGLPPAEEQRSWRDIDLRR